jgi:ribosomal protein S18 acetylase RimI-like enzyme
MDIRPFQSADRDGCLDVFDSNTPRFFRPAERPEFEQFLGAPNCPYFVLEHNGAIAGCGGYAVESDTLASLVWGMVSPHFQGQGAGRFLLMFRLREITRLAGVESVRLATSQHTVGFFERQGFKVVSVHKDGCAAGLDRIEMKKKLRVCV